MKTHSFIKKSEIKMKDGTVLPEGKRFVIRWEETSIGPRPRVRMEGAISEYKIAHSSAIKMMGKKVPSMSSLARWGDNGNCKSVMGEVVEPDGTDSYGSPSWLIVKGLI